MLWVGLVASMAAVASAVFAFVQAKAATDSRREAQEAQERAEKAEREAIRIASEARDALGRSASALEKANDIAEAATREHIAWELHEVGSTRYRLVNSGRIVAYGAMIEAVSGWVEADETEPRDVGPGDSLYFNAMVSFNAETPRAKVSCEDRSGAEPQRIENILTLG